MECWLYRGASGNGNGGSILQSLQSSPPSWLSAQGIQPYFILGFAREDDSAVGSGIFSPHWDSSITAGEISFSSEHSSINHRC